MLAIDPTDQRFVVMVGNIDRPVYGCEMNVSGDGGRSWTGIRPVSKLPAGAESCYAPEVAFDDDGRLYLLFVGLHTAGNVPMGAFLSTSTDRGRSFSTPRRVVGPNAFGVRLAVDRSAGNPRRVHLVWIQANSDPPVGGFPSPPNPIYAAHSDDGGKTFSSPVQVSDPARERLVAPAVALGPDQEVHVLYYDLRDDARDYHGLEGPTWEGEWSLIVSTSIDGGRTFARHSVVDDAVTPPERALLILTMPPPSIAVDGSGGLYVAWHDGRNGDWDVFLRRSAGVGAPWSDPLRLNDDPAEATGHQYLPRLSVAPGGRIDAVFYDRRNDPDNLRNDVSLTTSTDSGVTFGPNVRLNRESFHSLVGIRYQPAYTVGRVEFGSRLAVVSLADRSLAAWTDTRNAITRSISRASGPTEQDVYATTVDLSDTGRGTRP